MTDELSWSLQSTAIANHRIPWSHHVIFFPASTTRAQVLRIVT
jgi:hypothetical protein